MAKREECMPCRGTGRVISNLGGKPQEVSCPWCGGDGVKQAEVDAQAAWLEQQGGRDGAREGRHAPAPPAGGSS